jgi:hypothetical protein
MFRRIVVILCCGLAWGSAVVGVVAAVGSLTVLDKPTVLESARAALGRNDVQDDVGVLIADAILVRMPPAGRTEAASAAIRRAGRDIVSEPEFQQLWNEAIATEYAAVFEGKRGVVVLDPTTTTRLARAQLSAINPELVLLLPTSTVLEVELATANLPDLQTEATWTKRLVFALPLALALYGIALAVSPRRVRTLRRIGWWLLGTGLIMTVGAFAVLQWGIPFAIRARDLQPSISRTLIEHASFAWWRIYGPPAALGAFGLSLGLVGALLQQRAPENRITRTVEELPEVVDGESSVDAWDCKI